MINEFALARLLHVLGVVFWIGGVAFVTTILLPAVSRIAEEPDRVALFEAVESRFALQARISTLVTGISGIWLIELLGAWGRFTQPLYWWMHAMVFVWLVFTLMLFVFEPLFLHRWFLRAAANRPRETFRLITRMHWVLLTVSLVALCGALAGSHGWLIGA